MSTVLLNRAAAAAGDTAARARASQPRLWETAFVAVALFLSTNALFPVLLDPSEATSIKTTAPNPNDPITRIAWVLVLACLLVAMITSGGRIFAAVARNPALAAFCYLAIASTLWSGVPGTTAKYSLELAFSTLLGLYMGVRFSVSRIAAMLSWTTAAVMLLSILFAIALPKYGIDHIRAGAWRGAFTTKNELGRTMVFGLIVWTVRALTGETTRLRGLVMMAGFVAVGFESQSRTALGVTGLTIGVLFLVWLMKQVDRELIPIKGLLVSALALVGVLSVVNVKLLVAAVGADYSLTGRTGIWAAVWKAIGVHPWIGYGYDAFWRGLEGPSIAVWRAAGPTPHSHDGYLDLLLHLGAVGLIVFLIAAATVWARSLRMLRLATGSASIFPIVFVALFLLYNLTESSLGDRGTGWIVFVAIAGAVSLPRGAQPAPAEAADSP